VLATRLLAATRAPAATRGRHAPSFDTASYKFTFAIFSNLNGRERPRIFDVAVARLWLLRPELIMNVATRERLMCPARNGRRLCGSVLSPDVLRIRREGPVLELTCRAQPLLGGHRDLLLGHPRASRVTSCPCSPWYWHWTRLWTPIPATAAVALAVVRTALEDRTLQKELPGYLEYADRVRYRLIPGIC